MMSDTAEDSLCFDCGIPMIVLNDPSEELVEAAGGFAEFRETIIALRGEYEEGSIDLAMCPQCHATALLGPQVMIEGEIVQMPEEDEGS